MKSELNRREVLRLARNAALIATGLGLTRIASANEVEVEAVEPIEPHAPALYAMKLYRIEGREFKLAATYTTVTDLAKMLNEPPDNVILRAAKTDGGGGSGGGGGGTKDITFGVQKN